jgi:hypothetical protein
MDDTPRDHPDNAGGRDRDWFDQTGETTEEIALDHARLVLASCREGVLAFGEHHVPVRFIVANNDGRLIASVPVATFFAGEHTLFVPEESDDALQLMLTAEQIEESLETDRWLAHHLRPEPGLDQPEHTKWAAFWIDAARHGPWVFDGDSLMQPNPLADDEARLCKALNADQPKLCAIVRCATDTDIESPVCVAVDAHGILIRARFGVLRALFDEPVANAAEAQQAIERLANDA